MSEEAKYDHAGRDNSEPSRSSNNDSSFEGANRNSTHTGIDIHPNYDGSDADSEGQEDDDVSINTDDLAQMILKKWEEDPTYDPGHLT